MEVLRARHRKEQKDLQATITQKKKSANKKTRKGVNDECARLESELKKRQEREIEDLDGGTDADEREDISAQPEIEDSESEEVKVATEESTKLTNGIASLSVEPGTPVEQPQIKRPNRQKARLARRAAEQEEAQRKAEEEALEVPDLAAQEQERMTPALKSRNLTVKEIRADGHCLYSAVADQLRIRGMGLAPRIRPTVMEGEEGYRTVRRTAATYIKEHREDFEPFLEEQFETYVGKVGETGEWGGELELKALAEAYEVDIGVLDGNGAVHDITGEGAGKAPERKKIWLAYHRHGFGLGEHYNSLHPAG